MTTRRAFTLVEMTIVIGIIVLLAGLTLAVSVSVVRGSEIRQTELTIRLLDTAIQEWEVQANRKVTYGFDDPQRVYDIQENDPQATRRLMTIIERTTAVRDILAQIDPESVKQIEDDNDPLTRHLEVLDAWGNRFIAVLPGRSWVVGDLTNLGYERDDDGSIRTDIEELCGAAVNRQICFVSAGPDGEFGDVRNTDQESQDFIQAQDNLFSYSPTVPDP